MLSKTIRRGIVPTGTQNENHFEELFYFDGTNFDAVIDWSNGEATLDKDGFSVPYYTGRRKIEPNSYIIHRRGMSGSGQRFYVFEPMIARIAIYRFAQQELQPVGQPLMPRHEYLSRSFAGL